MPAKYVIHPKPTPPRVRPIGKLGIIDWREDCSSCKNCVKKGCIYGLYTDESETLHNATGYLDYIYQCKGCLACVQNCTKNILTRTENPEYAKLGDDYYTPEIVTVTWFQAESGKIPVSGSGYGGKFSGPGFDSMWTDMSEIVRPTRDGIHGREYINTGLDIGRKLTRLEFFDGKPTTETPPFIESPAPIMFQMPPKQWRHAGVAEGIAKAAEAMGLFYTADAEDFENGVIPTNAKAIPTLTSDCSAAKEALMVIVPDSATVMDEITKIKADRPKQVVAVRVEATPAATDRIVELTAAGAEVIYLVLDMHGRETGADNPRHARDVLRDIHGTLVKAGTRDEITIIACGGVALAEHMTKSIICGADMIAIDIPLVLAMECRLCGECQNGEECQVEMAEVDGEFAKQRIINLVCAWRNQLLEMLGAMGIREVRRLRGETGRAMFFEDLEERAFGRLFGERIKQNGGAQ